MEPSRAAELALTRIRAKTDILEYIKWMRPEGLPDFHHQPAQHHRLFAQKINTLAESIRLRHEREDRMATSVPPGSAKSFYWSIVGPTFIMAADPSLKIICANASESLAEDFARRRRQIMLTRRWQMLAESNLMADARSLSFQGTPEGGGIYAVGAGSTIQGLRADAVIGDDLVTGHEEASSLTQLDKKWKWYLSEARARLRPGGAEALIATRWALLDPIGRVLRLTDKGLEHWDYTRIPMICDAADDPLGRRIGDRLWPTYFTQRMVEDAQRDPLIWQTLYQQNPAVTEFAWVPLEKIHIGRREEFPELRYYIGVDISLGVQKGDFTVFVVMGVDQRKHVYIVDLYRKQASPNETAQEFLHLCERWNVRSAWVENDNASVMWGKIVDMEARQLGLPNRLQLSRMKNREKEVRASHLRHLFWQDRVHVAEAEWNQAFLKEIAEFPDGRNDDIVDGAAVVAKELRLLSGPLLVRTAPPPPIQGAIIQQEGLMVTAEPLEKLWKPAVSLGRRRRI